MTETVTTTSGIWKLIRIPALITLVITVVRLMGELQHWSTFWFNPNPGGGGALIGIVWLVPIFGVYFALKLKSMGETPKIGRATGFVGLGVLIIVGGSLLIGLVFHMGTPTFIILFQVIAAIGVLAYGFAARIPVIVIMFFAIKGNWGTHYDGPPPGFPEMNWFAKFVAIGVLPQILFWVTFTMIFGALAGAIAVAIARKRNPALLPTS